MKPDSRHVFKQRGICDGYFADNSLKPIRADGVGRVAPGDDEESHDVRGGIGAEIIRPLQSHRLIASGVDDGFYDESIFANDGLGDVRRRKCH